MRERERERDIYIYIIVYYSVYLNLRRHNLHISRSQKQAFGGNGSKADAWFV